MLSPRSSLAVVGVGTFLIEKHDPEVATGYPVSGAASLFFK
jgi:hypothetical protein